MLKQSWMTLGALGLALLGTGCLNLKPKPDLTRYYVLSDPGTRDYAGTTSPERGPVWYVERVEVPEYLDSREMITRRGEREVVYSAAHHWAEPIRDGITRVLRDVLARRLGPGSVAASLSRRPTGRFLELQASVSRFEWTTDQQAILQVRWQITEQPARRLIAAGQSSVREKVDPAQLDYLGGAAALSRCLESWGAELASIAESGDPAGPARPAPKAD